MTARKISISNLILPSAVSGRAAPEWLKDAIDAVLVAGLLLTLALAVL